MCVRGADGPGTMAARAEAVRGWARAAGAGVAARLVAVLESVERLPVLAPAGDAPPPAHHAMLHHLTKRIRYVATTALGPSLRKRGPLRCASRGLFKYRVTMKGYDSFNILIIMNNSYCGTNPEIAKTKIPSSHTLPIFLRFE